MAVRDSAHRVCLELDSQKGDEENFGTARPVSRMDLEGAEGQLGVSRRKVVTPGCKRLGKNGRLSRAWPVMERKEASKINSWLSGPITKKQRQ